MTNPSPVVTDRLKLASDTVLLFARNAFLRLLKVPVFLAMTSVLGPEGFGLLKLIDWIPTLAKYGNISFATVIVREVRRVTDENGSLIRTKTRDVAFTTNLAWGFTLSLAPLIASFFFSEPEIVWGLRIAWLSWIIYEVANLFRTNCKITRNFRALASAEVFGAVAGSVFVLATIWFWGIYACLFGGVITATAICILLRRNPGLHFKISWDRPEFLRQLRIAVPLALLTLSNGLNLWTERFVVAAFWGIGLMGRYMVIVIGIEVLQIFLTAMLQAVGVHLYERLGQKTGEVRSRTLLVDPTLSISVFVPILGAFVIFWGPNLVLWLLPEYGEISDLMPWLVINFWLVATPSLYLTSLTTTRVSRQSYLLMLRLCSVGVFSIIAWYLWQEGWGIEGALAARTLSLTMVFGGGMLLGRSIFHPSWIDFSKAIGLFLLPLLWAAIAIMLAEWMFPSGQQALICRPAMFLVLYAPVVLGWELRTGMLREIALPLILRRKL